MHVCVFLSVVHRKRNEDGKKVAHMKYVATIQARCSWNKSFSIEFHIVSASNDQVLSFESKPEWGKKRDAKLKK